MTNAEKLCKDTEKLAELIQEYLKNTECQQCLFQNQICCGNYNMIEKWLVSEEEDVKS